MQVIDRKIKVIEQTNGSQQQKMQIIDQKIQVIGQQNTNHHMPF